MKLGNLLFLLAIAYPTSSFTSDETCDYCQTVLKGVHGYFASSGSAPSKRVLVRQLKHHCNRHFSYRRRCLVLVKTHFSVFLDALRHSPFQSTDTCLAVNECRPGPIETVAPIVSPDSGFLERELELFFMTLGTDCVLNNQLDCTAFFQPFCISPGY